MRSFISRLGIFMGLIATILGLLGIRAYFQRTNEQASSIVVTSRRPAGQEQVSWWWVVLAGAAALFLGLGLLDIFVLIVRPLALLFLGITLATALEPVIGWLNSWLPRIASVILVYLILILVLVGIGWIVIPPLVEQAEQVVSRVPDLIDQAQQRLDRIDQLDGVSILESISSQISNIGGYLVSLPLSIGASLLDIVVVTFLSLYWLIMQPSIKDFINSLFPMDERRRVNSILGDMGGAMGGYLRGSVINGVIVGLISYFGFLLIGLDFPLVLGLIAAVFELVPVLGPIIAGAIAVGIALLQSPSQALITLVFVTILQQVENNVLVPNIMRTQTDVSPLLAVFALLIGSSIGGVLGALTAIPVAAALRVLVVRVIAPAVRRKTGAVPGSAEI